MPVASLPPVHMDMKLAVLLTCLGVTRPDPATGCVQACVLGRPQCLDGRQGWRGWEADGNVRKVDRPVCLLCK